MRTFLSLLALLGLSLAAPPALPLHKDVPSELIMGGHRAYQSQFPYYVYLHDCGGSLLTPTHVLTAAHCVDQSSVGNTVVMGLDDNKNYDGVQGVQIRKIVAVESHTNFNTVDWHDDIAILELDQPFEITDYAQLTNIKADDAELQKQHWTTVVGFGLSEIINGNQGVWPQYLQYAYIPLIDHDQCLKRWSNLWEKQVCAGAEKQGTGPGDSGGPMTVMEENKFFQIGIVSYGSASVEEIKNQAKTPVVYTRTASYCDWMTEKTKGAYRCIGDEKGTAPPCKNPL